MARESSVVIITYNGVDGACAAAVALLKHPNAQVLVSSARGIAECFETLHKKQSGSIHVCGLGMGCAWSALEAAIRPLKKQGVKIYWHCGRQYLDEKREAFAGVAKPCFTGAGTNTAALAEHFGVADRREGQWLIEMSWHDKHVVNGKGSAGCCPDEQDWLDLIPASLAHYFKFQDRQPYINTIRKLARQEFTEEDRREIERFRHHGYTYLLHGDSAVLRQLKDRIKRCADADRPIIITGESGTGKEHVAHLLQERGKRAAEPFIPVNCALFAGSVNLANATLFGHKKGAFTGADQERSGKFVEADGGILFLDELGELPLEVQAKLLRILEDGYVTPEGSDELGKKVDVQVIAATHRNLPQMIREGTFRADLYHRLSTLRLHIAPLREHIEDIDIIIQNTLEKLAQEGAPRVLTKKDYALLKKYHWPGNVRQLTKLLDRAILLDISIQEALDEERSLGELVENRDAPSGEALFPTSLDEIRPMKEIQQRYAQRAWELHQHNYTAAAQALGVQPNTLRYSLLRDGA
jgi:two-component system, NtrC family, response regulator PilR